MAFVVEDGTGLENSNSYQSVADAKAFHLDRGLDIAAVPYSDTQIQASCVRATDYLDKKYGRRIRGFRRKRIQSLEFPRTDAQDDEGFTFIDLPKALLAAHSEYMLLDLQLSTLTPLPNTPFPVVDPATGVITAGSSPLKKSKDTLGPLEEEREYATNSGNLSQIVREYPVADLWMEELLQSSLSGEIIRG